MGSESGGRKESNDNSSIWRKRNLFLHLPVGKFCSSSRSLVPIVDRPESLIPPDKSLLLEVSLVDFLPGRPADVLLSKLSEDKASVPREGGLGVRREACGLEDSSSLETLLLSREGELKFSG